MEIHAAISLEVLQADFQKTFKIWGFRFLWELGSRFGNWIFKFIRLSFWKFFKFLVDFFWKRSFQSDEFTKKLPKIFPKIMLNKLLKILLKILNEMPKEFLKKFKNEKKTKKDFSKKSTKKF